MIFFVGGQTRVTYVEGDNAEFDVDVQIRGVHHLAPRKKEGNAIRCLSRVTKSPKTLVTEPE